MRVLQVESSLPSDLYEGYKFGFFEHQTNVALDAFERLRDNNAKALASWIWQEPIEWELPGAKVGSLSSDLVLNGSVLP
jgi:hypothetical protein